MQVRQFLTGQRPLCGHQQPENRIIDEVEEDIAQFRLSRPERKRRAWGESNPLMIDVVFHVIHDGSKYKISKDLIDAQIDVLNKACTLFVSGWGWAV